MAAKIDTDGNEHVELTSTGAELFREPYTEALREALPALLAQYGAKGLRTLASDAEPNFIVLRKPTRQEYQAFLISEKEGDVAGTMQYLSSLSRKVVVYPSPAVYTSMTDEFPSLETEPAVAALGLCNNKVETLGKRR